MTNVCAERGTAVESPDHAVGEFEPVSERDIAHALVTTLPERGLDRMTPGQIESVLCTSALTAHI
jgi:hypothetical protein